MEQQSDDLRERLLSRLPQPENLVAYREETAELLAKHDRALSTEKWTTTALSLCGFGAVAFFSWMVNTHPFDVGGQLRFLGGTLVFVLLVAIIGVRLPIYASQVATLKEIKQVQLQILELHAALQNERSTDRQPSAMTHSDPPSRSPSPWT